MLTHALINFVFVLNTLTAKNGSATAFSFIPAKPFVGIVFKKPLLQVVVSFISTDLAAHFGLVAKRSDILYYA